MRLRIVEAIYLAIISVMIVYHLLMGLPFIVETSGLILGGYAWVFVIPVVVTVGCMLLRQSKLIRELRFGFHVVSAMSAVLSIFPIISMLPHLFAFGMGVGAWRDQFIIVRELFFENDIKALRDSTYEQYGREDFSNIDDEAEEDTIDAQLEGVSKFLQKDMELNKQEYIGFEERLAQEIESNRETVVDREVAYDLSKVELEDAEFLVSVGGNYVLDLVDEDVQNKIFSKYNKGKESSINTSTPKLVDSSNPIKEFLTHKYRGSEDYYDNEVYEDESYAEDDYYESYESYDDDEYYESYDEDIPLDALLINDTWVESDDLDDDEFDDDSGYATNDYDDEFDDEFDDIPLDEL